MQISRRGALLGATAAVAVAGVPTAVAAQASEPLVALEAQLVEARAEGEKLNAVWSAAYDKAGAWAFGWPHAEFSNPAMEQMRGWLGRDADTWYNREGVVPLTVIQEFNRHTEMLVFGGDEVLARVKAEGCERIRWWFRTDRAQKAAQEAVGLQQKGGACEDNTEIEHAIEKQIRDTPAETLRGVVIKLREVRRDYVMMECDDNDDFYAVTFGLVLADLERLAGRVGT